MRISEIFYSIQGEGKLAGVPSAFIRASGCNLRCVWCDTPYASWEPEGEQCTVDQIMQKISAFPTRHAVVTGGEPMIMPDIGELCDALKKAGYHITIETAATVFESVKIDLASLSPKLANSTPGVLVAPSSGTPGEDWGGGRTGNVLKYPLPSPPPVYGERGKIASPSTPSSGTPGEGGGGGQMASTARSPHPSPPPGYQGRGKALEAATLEKIAASHEKNRLNIPVIQQFIETAPEFQLKFVVSNESDLSEIRAILNQLKNFSPSDVLLMPEGIDAKTLQQRSHWIGEICKREGFRFCPRLHVLLYGNQRGT